MADDVHELHLRICRLEAELARTAGQVETLGRRWRRALRGGIAVAAATLASATSFTLRAQAPPPNNEAVFTAPFRVVDKSGKIIMIVNESPRSIDLRDEQGIGRILLSPASTPGISLTGYTNIGVSLSSGILNGLHIRRNLSKGGVGNDEVPAHVEAALEVNEFEGGKLWVANKTGKNVLYAAETVAPGDGRVAIGASKGGAFGIRVYSAADKLQTSMGETKTGESAVAAYDAAGLARSVMFGKDGQFSSMSTAGQPVAVLTSKDNVGEIAVNNSSQVTVAMLKSETSLGTGLIGVTDVAGHRQATMVVDGEGEGKMCIMDLKRGEICIGRKQLPGMLPGVAH